MSDRSDLLLAIADDELFLGWRNSEWTGIAPFLEEDVAFSSIAQNEIGHARALYELAARELDTTADELAFDRDADEYRCAPLVQLRRLEWARTIARHWLYETADEIRLAILKASDDSEIAGIASKIDREEAYHRMHAEMWVERLLATGEGRRRFNEAVDELWPYALGVLDDALRPELRERVEERLGRKLPDVEPVPRGRHETERGWLIAGGKGPVPRPRLPDADPEVAARVREARARTSARLVVTLQPLTAKPAKQWPLARWVELGRAVVERMGGLVVLMGSASERAALEAFRSLGERCVDTFGVPIAGLVAAVRESDAFVGHDSGPFHVAVAAGTPSVALVGPSDPKYARYPSPLPVRALRRCVLAAENEECPLYLSCRDARCLPSLGVDEVLAALDDLLSESRRAR